MGELFALTKGPITVTGDVIQPITSVADILNAHVLTILIRVLHADPAKPLSIYLYTSTQAEQDDFGTDPASPQAGGSFVNILTSSGGAPPPAVSGADKAETHVVQAGVIYPDTQLLRTLRWASQGDGTFTIDVVARRMG